MGRFFIIAVAACTLAACETTNESEWIGTGEPQTPFDQAEDTCEKQIVDIEEEDADKTAIFIRCLAAFGWEPRPEIRQSLRIE
ncbi:hypothetical protein [Qipengyuania sp. JC766]|uniref:hypothetical protein n=1 Tax=Qipengyuania sp. JC766 TaxID=3232139 RepID=UPI00345A4DE2